MKTDLKKFDKISYIKKTLDESQMSNDSLYSVNKSGLEIVVFKNVFSPIFFDDSEYFANNLNFVKGLTILEIGTGTGLIALKLAQYDALKIIATDINPSAVTNARYNVNKYNLNAIINIREGNLFEPVSGEKFDLIFWNMPFCYLDIELKQKLGMNLPLNDLEKSVFNSYYIPFFNYLNEGFKYLTTNGRILIGFSPTIGREDILNELVEDLNLTKVVLKEDKLQIKDKQETLQILEFKKR